MVLFSVITLLDIRTTWVYLVQELSASKSKTNGEYYQKSDYRLL